jgi:hypothetical protein
MELDTMKMVNQRNAFLLFARDLQETSQRNLYTYWWLQNAVPVGAFQRKRKNNEETR